MKLNRRRLRRLIKEEYSKVLKEMYMGGGHLGGSYRGSMSHAGGNFNKCVDLCIAAIPPMMKQICAMGMARSVHNDIYHICEPIAQKMGCDPDDVHEEVMTRLGG